MSIMVPLDTSELSSSALDMAARLAGALGELLILVTVADRDALDSVEELARAEGDDPREVLEAHLRTRAQDMDLSADIELLPGEDTAGSIIDRAQHEDVDMIVMATHGRTGLSRWQMGSVAERVVRGATVPTLVIPPPWRRKSHT